MAKKLVPLVVIVGQTASGKSDLGMFLAQKFNGEIIAADSWTVRKEVNIGTSKPTIEDQAKVKHHMIDVVSACADYTVALYKDQAISAIDDISRRDKLPIMVGGTGLYIDSVLFDYSFLDDLNDDLSREELNKMSLDGLIKCAIKNNLPLDRIDIRNKRRIIRLIETNGKEPSRQPLRQETLVIGIKVTKEILRERIQERTEKMLSKGLETEVRELVNKYGWDCEALKGIGYIEWRAYFEGKQTLDATKQLIVSNTLKLSKRQSTWFKRNKIIHWVTKQSDAVELVTTLLNKT